MWTEQIGHEVYVYRNGILLMKKWLYSTKNTYSVVFDKCGTYGKGTLKSIR